MEMSAVSTWKKHQQNLLALTRVLMMSPTCLLLCTCLSEVGKENLVYQYCVSFVNFLWSFMWNELTVIRQYLTDPQVLFVTPSTSLRYVLKEGEDLLLPCLLTDPNATDFTFRMDNCSAVPPGMNVTFDPRKGVLIRNLHPGYNADYVCSGRIRGVEKVSKTFSINVIQREFQ